MAVAAREITYGARTMATCERVRVGTRSRGQRTETDKHGAASVIAFGQVKEAATSHGTYNNLRSRTLYTRTGSAIITSFEKSAVSLSSAASTMAWTDGLSHGRDNECNERLELLESLEIWALENRIYAVCMFL